jgi:hypothetical protein
MNSRWQQYRLGIILALAVALPLLWFFLLYGPQRQHELSLQAEFSSAEQQHRDVTERLQVASAVAAEKIEVEQRWHELTSCLYPADSAELLLQHLSSVAAGYNLAVLERQLEFGPLLGKLGARRSLGQMEAVSLRFSGRGRYLEIGEFLAALDREAVVAGIDAVEMQYRAAADPEIYFDLSLRVYLLTAAWSS